MTGSGFALSGMNYQLSIAKHPASVNSPSLDPLHAGEKLRLSARWESARVCGSCHPF
jgi:hypothetical protein